MRRRKKTAELFYKGEKIISTHKKVPLGLVKRGRRFAIINPATKEELSGVTLIVETTENGEKIGKLVDINPLHKRNVNILDTMPLQEAVEAARKREVSRIFGHFKNRHEARVLRRIGMSESSHSNDYLIILEKRGKKSN